MRSLIVAVRQRNDWDAWRLLMLVTIRKRCNLSAINTSKHRKNWISKTGCANIDFVAYVPW